MVEQNRSQSTGPSTPYPSGPTTPMRGQASVAQYWVKHTRLDCVELLGPEACAVRTWWNDAPPAGTSTCTALLESKDGSSIADTKVPSLKWERIGCLWVPGTTWRQPLGERKVETTMFSNFAVRQAYTKESDMIMYYTCALYITLGWIKKLFVNRLPSNLTANFTKWKGSVAHSLRKQSIFCDATTGFPAKWRLSDDCRKSILLTRHYSVLGGAFDWSCH